MKRVLGIYRDSTQQLMLRHLTENNPIIGAIFLLGVSTGLRISDLLNLRADIRQNFTVTEGKTGKSRLINLSDDVWKILQNYVKNKNLQSSDRLFKISRQTVHKHISRLGTSIGLSRLGTHSMRVTYAYNVYRLSRCLNFTREAMNHKYISTTILYLIGGFEWLLDEFTPNFEGILPNIDIFSKNKEVEQ